MTAYQNFVEDYPNRCLEVLNLAKRLAKEKGRDVTLLLIVASAGLIVPLERLKVTEREIHPTGDIERKSHPTGDADRFQSAARELGDLLGSNFWGSELAKDGAGWRSGKINSIDTPPDTWPELEHAKTISRDKQCRSVMNIIRNALAHGNIFTRSDPKGVINEIVFASQKSQDPMNGYNFLSVKPDAFEAFLRCWFKFLSDNHIPMDQIKPTLFDEAA